jgi:GNAT superfamily N-acetyltransferase
MKIINYTESENKDLWLSELEKCDWGAGQYLAYLLKENKLDELVGENSRVLMLTEGEDLISFCTLAKFDDVQPTDLSPWIGFVYTYPEYPGKRLSGELLTFAEKLAKQDGATKVYISTNHTGLYEKYGYEFYMNTLDIEGEETRVYRKKL